MNRGRHHKKDCKLNQIYDFFDELSKNFLYLQFQLIYSQLYVQIIGYTDKGTCYYIMNRIFYFNVHPTTLNERIEEAKKRFTELYIRDYKEIVIHTDSSLVPDRTIK